MEKRRVITSFEKLPISLMQSFKEKYPDFGLLDTEFVKIELSGKTQYALPFETEDAFHLVKIQKKISLAKEIEFEKMQDDEDEDNDMNSELMGESNDYIGDDYQEDD